VLAKPSRFRGLQLPQHKHGTSRGGPWFSAAEFDQLVANAINSFFVIARDFAFLFPAQQIFRTREQLMHFAVRVAPAEIFVR